MKLGQSVKVKTAIKNGYERVIQSHLDGVVKSFTIIGMPNKYTELYTILLDDAILGWTINKFHVDNCGIDKKYLGKKFFDIDNSYII